MDGETQAQNPQARPAAHPMEAFMQTALDRLKAMVDVNTILGVPVEAPDGTVIIPVSRVSFGFVAGGSEFETEQASPSGRGFPFGGGSGAGVSLSPVAFLVVGRDQVRLLPVSDRALWDRILDLVPGVFDQLQRLTGRDGGPRMAGPQEAVATGDGQARESAARSGAPAMQEPAQARKQPSPGPVADAERESGPTHTGRARGSLTLRFE